MEIKYFLQLNPLTADVNDHSAQVQYAGTLYTNDILRRCLKRGTSLTESDLLAANNLLESEMSDAVAEGYIVSTGLYVMRPSIKGVFVDAADTFDPARHSKRATVAASELVNAKVRNAKVVKVTGSKPMPTLIQYTDINSSTSNSLLTPGGIGNIVGEELKFDPTNPQEGIFMVPTDGSPETKVDVIAKRTQGELMFGIPSGLVAGNYNLEVRRAYGVNGDIRIGVLGEVLQVA